jgi:transcriptional regulator with XRE-family HTH domain/ribosomal protein S18 acetylase RimI-like enzyme
LALKNRNISSYQADPQAIDEVPELRELRGAIERKAINKPLWIKLLSKEALRDLEDKGERGRFPWSKSTYGRLLLLDWKEATKKITVRRAEKNDARIIASWATNRDEVAFIGEFGEILPENKVHQWINNALGAFVLEYLKQKTPVAFANISLLENNKQKFEVGRLLVAPEWRRMGLGSSLLQHLCSMLGEIRSDPHLASIGRGVTLARVVAQNNIGIRLIEALPFRKETKVTNLPDSTICKWYRYLDGSEVSRFGKEVRTLREKIGISQEYLAFQVGLKRTTINMIELGQRFPSFGSLPKICTILGRENQDQRIKLLLAAIGEEREKYVYPSISEEHDASQDLWVITDKLAELEPELQSYLLDSIHALESSFDRYYFLPLGAWDKQGKILFEKFRSANVNENTLSQHFRFYETDDEALCVLRVAIENPKSLGKIKATIGGEGYTRVPLDAEQSSRLRDFIKSKIDKLEANQKIKGYHSCFPERTK